MDLRAEAPPRKTQILVSADPASALDSVQRALLAYARKITLSPSACRRADVEALKAVGATDVEIHAAVQTAAYFNYINRVADALGVESDPD